MLASVRAIHYTTVKVIATHPLCLLTQDCVYQQCVLLIYTYFQVMPSKQEIQGRRGGICIIK